MSVLRVSRKERRRLEVFARVKRGELSLKRAAELIGLSYRQALRSYERFRTEGDAGVVHRLRGRRSNHQSPPGLKQRVLALYRKKYFDHGPTLAAEEMQKEDNLRVTVSVLRRWLLEAGLWKPRKRGVRHRRWRERRASLGELVQMDGSLHDWFEGRRGRATLIVMIDDATNRMYARFFEEETTAAVMETFRSYLHRHGLPRSLYVDRDSIYETTRDATIDENLREAGPLTQFGRAMKDLDVELLLAHSPQAKGRVERRHGVLQDRLVKALRRKGISTLEAANDFLEKRFLEPFNKQFEVLPRQAGDLHRRISRSLRLRLDHILSFQEKRVVKNDWTVQWRGRFFQLTEANRKVPLAGSSLLMCEHLDGSIHLWHRGRELTWIELPDRPTPKKTHRVATATGKPYKPPADHPWRKPVLAPQDDT